MPKQFPIICILALIFCMAGHFFMTAYTEYNVNHSRLKVLRSQERSVKHKTKEFEQKKKSLEQVTRFVQQASQLGLTKNKWDTFFVNLKDEPLSYSSLQNILAQTSNSRHYYFKPESLVIQMINEKAKSDDAKNNPVNAITPSLKAAGLMGPETNQSGPDLTISLKGHFLVKQRGGPNH